MLTERRVQRAIYLHTHRRYQVVMPNYTPAGWWECDVWGVTKAGYGVEWEVKLTVSDFRKDAEKKHDAYTRLKTSVDEQGNHLWERVTTPER